MEGHIQKWGNSLGLRIPIQFAKQLHLRSGSTVRLEIQNEQIIIKPLKYDLESMLNDINSKNLHNEIFNDEQFGNEEW